MFFVLFGIMAKRSADKELNHDNWDDEEAPEEAGLFKTATPEVISKRVIRTAKRRMPQSGQVLPCDLT
jgi:nuclear pore complex protein Nup50